MEAWEVEARVAVQHVFASYVRFADTGRSADLAGLFTEDGVLRTDGSEVAGPAAITAFLEDAKRSLAADPRGAGRIRHHVSSVYVTFPTPTEARATSYFLAVTAAGPDHWGRYRDRLARVGDEWRFTQREAAVEG
ncbi:MAG TPA: nuclear transport factor 2 family protein, partial [Acidimicrobiia bacterium]|nr:nuclear transport factor 2 family protein [Acidimicrobiia bacterium]